MVMADEVVRPLLSLSEDMVAVESIARKAWVTPCVAAFEDGEREVGHAARVDLVRSEADCGVNGVM